MGTIKRSRKSNNNLGPKCSSRKKFINVAMINIRSVNNKVTNLCESISSKHIDICCITETWVYEGDTSIYSEIRNRGFKFLNQPRLRKKGGGVGILTKQNIKIQQTNVYPFNTFEHLLISCSLMSTNHKYIFCTIYRTGLLSSDGRLEFLKEFETLLTQLEEKNEPAIILGDFNFHISDDNDKAFKEFMDLMESFGFVQLICDPTHILGQTLDLLFVKTPDLISELTIYNESNDVLLFRSFFS